MSESVRVPLRFDTVVVVGGGCYGSYYVRQLERARNARALTIDRLVVVDRDPACDVARRPPDGAGLQPVIVTAEWTEFFADYLGRAADSPATAQRDAIVPSPLMPHLLYEWLRTRVAAACPERIVEQQPLDADLPVPWQRAGDDGTHYASFATWMCPINCIEPARCPHTRAARDWSMPVALERHAGTPPGRADAGTYVFHCTHRAYGVGMIDVGPVLAADADLRRRAGEGSVDALIGTVSHCHGAVSRLVVSSPSPSPSPSPRPQPPQQPPQR